MSFWGTLGATRYAWAGVGHSTGGTSCPRANLLVLRKRRGGFYVPRLGLLLLRLDGRTPLPIALRLPRPDGLAIGFDILALALASGFPALFLGVVLLGHGHGGSSGAAWFVLMDRQSYGL